MRVISEPALFDVNDDILLSPLIYDVCLYDDAKFTFTEVSLCACLKVRYKLCILLKMTR